MLILPERGDFTQLKNLHKSWTRIKLVYDYDQGQGQQEYWVKSDSVFHIILVSYASSLGTEIRWVKGVFWLSWNLSKWPISSTTESMAVSLLATAKRKIFPRHQHLQMTSKFLQVLQNTHWTLGRVHFISMPKLSIKFWEQERSRWFFFLFFFCLSGRETFLLTRGAHCWVRVMHALPRDNPAQRRSMLQVIFC